MTISKSSGIFRVGTSGIVVPGSKNTFPVEFQGRSRLSYYSSLFNSIEINSTFHKLPMVSTIERWSGDVAEGFLFTLKLWKEITHVKKLDINLENIDTFFTAADRIGSKKGCLLVQFPGSITAEYSQQVRQILQRIQKLDHQNRWSKAVEFRSVTWYVSETSDLLDRYDASLVLHDMPKSKNFEVIEKARFIYFRFHGPTGNYRGSYSDEFLTEHADKMRNFLNSGKDVYAYFNNTMGNAYENAMSLKAMVEK